MFPSFGLAAGVQATESVVSTSTAVHWTQLVIMAVMTLCAAFVRLVGADGVRTLADAALLLFSVFIIFVLPSSSLGLSTSLYSYY